MKVFNIIILAALLGIVLLSVPATAQAQSGRVVVEDFEAYETGVQPYRWKRPHRKSRSLVEVPRALERDDDYFEIVREGGGKRARAYTRDESTQIVRVNGESFQWNLKTHPRLAWEWRADKLPEGARESSSKTNDSGAAVYVTFGTDWLGRPKSIKYTYSSTLPVGTMAKYGPLRVIVASSGRDGLGQWKRIERDVVADYRAVFGGDPPDEPISITLWSDSDDTGSVAEVYFDNLILLPR